MKVYINYKYHDFDSGYNSHNPSNNGWKKQNQDAFKFSSIGGIRVFVKRFEKDASNIPGYQFLVKVKNKKYSSLPMIYDIVNQIEDSKTVIYLFQEVIEGNTFEEIMHNDVLSFNPKKFLKNIYDALLTIKNNGYWYSDFVEKNIFVAKNGDFYLIDLDSVVPLSILPNEDNSQISQVNKNYKIAISTYWYRDTFNYPFSYIAKNLKGDTINFLELLIFIAQIKYYIDNISYCDFLDVKTRKAIPQYLLDKDNALTYACFKSSFLETSNHQQIPSYELLDNYLNKVLFSKNETIRIDFNNRKIIQPTQSPTTNNVNASKESLADKIKKENEEKIRQEKIKREQIDKLIKAITVNIDVKNYNAAEKNIYHILQIEPNNYTVKTLQQTIRVEKQNEEKRKQQEAETKRRKIVELNNKKGNWFVALLAHIFGCGLYYVDKSINRKWIYPTSLFYAIFVLIMVANQNEPFSEYYGGFSDFGIITFLLALFFTYFIGSIDVLITNYSRNEKIDKEIKALQ